MAADNILCEELPLEMTRPITIDHLLLQWHITDQCNLRCRHCYQEGYSDSGPDFELLIEVLDQYVALLGALRPARRFRRLPGHINITGGEPFLRQDFLSLLMQIHKRGISFGILTNGTLIDKGIAGYLKTVRPQFVQVSLEGAPERHDSIRGAGSHARTLDSLRLLKKNRIRTLVSFTAHQENFRDFPAVAEACRKNGVSRLWADRLIPVGGGELDAPRSLTQDETRDFFALMTEAAQKGRGSLPWLGKMVAMHRSLQFLAGGGKPYRCNAGRGLIAILPDSTVLPCRRMPISAGNLFEKSLKEIYFESDLLNELRDNTKIIKGCEDCRYLKGCRGGLRCLAHAVTGDPFNADPGCWLAK